MNSVRYAPVPDDFVERSKSESHLGRHYGVGRKVITRWRKEAGMPTDRNLEVPEDFAERALSATNADLGIHYGVGRKVITRWRKEAGVPADLVRHAGHMKMEAPADFRDVAVRYTNRQLAERFGVGEKMITRWRKETGCTAPLTAFSRALLPKQFVPPPPSGRANEAAQFLRPTHRPVYHRVIEGKEFEGQYVCGTQVLSADEIIAYAETRGFEPMREIFRSRFADV